MSYLLSKCNHLCEPQEDLAKLAKQLQGRKASIGVKKLLGLIDMVSAALFPFFKLPPLKQTTTWILDKSISQTVRTKLLSPGETDGATGSCEQADVQTGGRAVHRSRCVIFQFLIFLIDSVDEERIHLALFQKYSIFPQKSSKWLWTLSFHQQAFTIQPNNF